MSLSDIQAEFLDDISKLITWANSQPGVRLRLGEGWRTESQQLLYYYGSRVEFSNRQDKLIFVDAGKPTDTKYSNHQDRLAQDLILDKHILCADNKKRWYYQKETEAYRFLGEYWESRNPKNRWGGRYGDGNHFERLK